MGFKSGPLIFGVIFEELVVHFRVSRRHVCQISCICFGGSVYNAEFSFQSHAV